MVVAEETEIHAVGDPVMIAEGSYAALAHGEVVHIVRKGNDDGEPVAYRVQLAWGNGPTLTYGLHEVKRRPECE